MWYASTLDEYHRAWASGGAPGLVRHRVVRIARRKACSTAVATSRLWCRKGRRRFGTESTHLSAGALIVIDGSKALKAGAEAAFRGQVLIQRCQWHKRENVISYLPRKEQIYWREETLTLHRLPSWVG